MMQFICDPCAYAGAFTDTAHDDPLGVRLAIAAHKRMFHARCKGGTWCDCQHKVSV